MLFTKHILLKNFSEHNNRLLMMHSSLKKLFVRRIDAITFSPLLHSQCFKECSFTLQRLFSNHILFSKTGDFKKIFNHLKNKKYKIIINRKITNHLTANSSQFKFSSTKSWNKPELKWEREQIKTAILNLWLGKLATTVPNI